MKKFKEIPEELVQIFKQVPLKGDFFDKKDLYAQKFKEALDKKISEYSESGASHLFLRNNKIWTWAAVWIGIIVMLGTSYYTGEQHIRTIENELVCYLPDNSQVTLSAHSEVSYNSVVWLFSRSLEFKGEATFKVCHGKRFTVRTEAGSVQVLGTEFKLSQADRDLHVECFEGCIKVTTETEDDTTVLYANEKVSIEKGRMQEKSAIITDEIPSKPQYLEFIDEPLENILLKIEDIFQIKIENMGCDISDLTFTGILPCDDQEQVLTILLGSCGISYSKENGVIYINKE